MIADQPLQLRQLLPDLAVKALSSRVTMVTAFQEVGFAMVMMTAMTGVTKGTVRQHLAPQVQQHAPRHVPRLAPRQLLD